ncbi:MAG: TlpA family protein disulfide reductase [Armatimonadetes bacterium]|nr:TlpA family protein disulfide reductase [Armatimonadota bacterium]
MPKLNELHEKYSKDGLVILAIHSDPDAEKGKTAVKETGMKYPVAIENGEFMKTLGCDSFPDYVLIDRTGKIRVVDLANGDIERASKILLDEK